MRVLPTCTVIGFAAACGRLDLDFDEGPVPKPEGFAGGFEYYVATDGDDARTCEDARSVATPKRSLTGGAGCLAPGATLFIRGGDYAEALADVVPGGVSWSAPVTVRSFGDEVVTLRPTAGASAVLVTGTNRAYILIEGLRVDAAAVAGDGFHITGGASQVRIRDCEVFGAPGFGVRIDGASPANELIGLTVHDNLGVHGIFVDDFCDRTLVEGCEVYNQPSHGIMLADGDFQIARGNRVHDSGSGISVYGGPGNVLIGNRSWNNNRGINLAYGTDDVLVLNNLLWGNSDGITVHDGSDDNLIYNNTMQGNGQGIVLTNFNAGETTERNVFRNNVVFGNSEDVADGGIATVFESNLVGLDPLFVDASAADFRLLAGSPAIDTGMPLPEVSIDITGTVRPQGSGYDAGAYELVP